MPTYVYACSSCETEFEIEQRITEPPLTLCGCGSEGTVRRLIQPTAIMFRGSGFHINDYQSKSSSSAPSEAPKADCTGHPTSCPACKDPA